MGEILRGGPENAEGLEGSQSAPQESTTGVIRVRVGEDFEPFSGLAELPKYDPEQGIDQDMFSVRIELDGIPGTLTLFPDTGIGRKQVKNPALSVEAAFQIKTIEEFRKLDALRLRLDANRNIRYLDMSDAELDENVEKGLRQNPTVEISASCLHALDGREGKAFTPKPNRLRQIRARFIPE